MDVNMVGTSFPNLQLFLLNHILAHRFTHFMFFSESDVLAFNGSSIVRWDLMREPVSAIKESIRFRFKTNQANGVLLYSRGTQNDYIAMEMKENRMCLNINLGMVCTIMFKYLSMKLMLSSSVFAQILMDL